ncbi:cysteine--tRNA ligase [[Mycoplasma] falconis]|uniref:Cysteine--tRNA ligase n=1 Tax=[Mycoplasma] falconis TaxID=92403 RepID=A0A501XAD5_9BACT|nr:cysteine--tRNA ligase [[Mycoplasma] falconis]TPE57535.1 cysteine--tRNA ligase [[Mycoplasma] falconis]
MKRYYLCGPTVYNYPHIGNLRPTVTFDLMIRAQRYLGEEVFYLHNITDIDDKIINKAFEENKTEKEISEFYEKYYLDLFTKFNLVLPNKVIRVTDSLNDMYQYIQEMINKGSAYQVGGNVFFDIQKHKDVYGSISNQKIDELNSEDDGVLGKKHKTDFTLWKSTTNGIKFESPFGLGRPGWHTECSCFIAKYFNGEQLDAHGGGIDLIFPHHENENIQHFSIYGQPIAKDWIHFGTLNYKNQKMSKSLGNIIYPHDFLETYSPDTYKILILTTNYSKPINITDELLETNQNQVNKFRLAKNKIVLENIHYEVDEEQVKAIIEDIARLDFTQGYAKLIKLFKNQADLGSFFKVLYILGFNLVNSEITEKDKQLYLKWKKLVGEKNFEEADKIREYLKERRII